MNSSPDPPVPAQPPSQPDSEAAGTDLWGPSLVHSLDSGLDWDPGSWMDPLFQELPPIAELPGLGERYRDLRLLGEGAMGRVYQATDTLLLRPVALKILKVGTWSALQEGRAQAKVEHPNVCRIYEVGRGFLVMELIDGPTLQALRPRLTLSQKVAVVRDVARGIHAAHQRDLVHLDLKPGNILVSIHENGAYHPVVGDFGMVLGNSSPSGARCPLGTPPYSSPEQLRGNPAEVDRRSDIYSIGVILYVLLAGRSPFPEQDAIARTLPVPLRNWDASVPPDLACIVHRCLAEDPADRYASAQGLAEDLDRFLQGAAVEAMPGSLRYRGGKWLRRNRWMAAMALGCLLVLAGVTGAAVHRDRSQAEREDWNHRFQLQIEDLRTRLDHGYRKPLHDVEPERSAAYEVIPAIEKCMAASPGAAGPGHLALGQVLLILNPNHPKAREHFQKAWDLGYRTEGARAWLAYALVNRPRIGFWDSLPWGEGAGPGLEQARHLLAGRSSTEQRRVAHLLDLAELAQSNETGSVRALQVARDFRRQFPDDIEAVLEEVQACCERALRLERTPSDRQPGPDGDPAVLIRSAERSVRSGLAFAPSHPEAYRILARVLIASERILPKTGKERKQLHGEIAHTFALGISAAPGALEIRFDRMEYLCTSRLLYDMENRALSGFADRLRQELEDAFVSGERSGIFVVLHGITTSINALESHGLPSGRILSDTISAIRKHRDTFLAEDAASWLPPVLAGFSRVLLQGGGDPRELSDLVPGGPAPRAQNADLQIRLAHELLVLEYLQMHGLDPGATLVQAQDLLARMKDRGGSRAFYREEIAEWEARAFDTPRAWGALEASLEAIEDSTPFSLDDWGVPTLVKARLLQVRHAIREGKGAGPLLQWVDEWLECRFSCLTKDTRIYHALRSERLLLGAFLEPAGRSRAMLADALREMDRVMELTRPRMGPPPRYRGLPDLADSPLPMGDLHLLRGEILLQASRRADGPGTRARFLGQGRQALHRATGINSNLSARARQILVNPGCSLY